MIDPLLELLDDLPAARLDRSRADRIRARCHAALVHQRRRATRPGRTARSWPSIVAGLGGLYITALVHQMLAFYGLA